MTAPDKLAEIAGSLDHDAKRFLERVVVGDGSRADLPYASPRQDRARRIARTLGLVAYCGCPRRWQPTPLGIAVRDHLKTTGGAA